MQQTVAERNVLPAELKGHSQAGKYKYYDYDDEIGE